MPVWLAQLSKRLVVESVPTFTGNLEAIVASLDRITLTWGLIDSSVSSVSSLSSTREGGPHLGHLQANPIRGLESHFPLLWLHQFLSYWPLLISWCLSYYLFAAGDGIDLAFWLLVVKVGLVFLVIWYIFLDKLLRLFIVILS